MEEYGDLPWPKIHEYLLQIGSCRTIDALMRTAVSEADRVIHADAVGIFRNQDGVCLELDGASEAAQASYNDYYRITQPVFLIGGGTHCDLDFFLANPIMRWDRHQDLEYAVDFMLPNGCYKTLAQGFDHEPISLSIQRSRTSPDFCDTDVQLLRILNQHLNNFYGCLEKKDDPDDAIRGVEQIAEHFGLLSRREAEICYFVARRLSNAEIGSSLFISRRTVEKHLESIFDKLDLKSRDELRKKLGQSVHYLWSPETAK
jgi:DNA-binding CsgD family transcriptional regulator